MKRPFIFLLIVISILLLFLIPCSAFNGQVSFHNGFGYISDNFVGLRFGGNNFNRPYTALTNDEGLSFTIQIPPRNDRTLYLVPFSGEYYSEYSYTLMGDYVGALENYNILPNDNNYGTGSHTIYMSDYTSIYGNYKLCLYDETDLNIYELYIFYIPSVDGSFFAVNFDRTDISARLRLFSGSTLINTIDNVPITESGTLAYTGSFQPTDSDQILSVSLSLGIWESSPTSDFYELNIPFISFDWSIPDTQFFKQKANWCSIGVVNNTKRTLYHVGNVNNITNYNDTNLTTNKGYSFFIPSNFADIGDVITLQLDFQFENMTLPFYYDIYVKGTSITAWNINGLDLGGKYNTLEEFEKAQQEYKDYFSSYQIDIDDIDLDINSYIDEDSIVKAFSLGNKILQFDLFFTILLIVIVIAVSSYIFFGKK